MTATVDASGRIVGYHSSRRCPERRQVDLFEELYAALLEEEKRHADWREGMAAATRILLEKVVEQKMDYPEFVFSA